MKKNDSSVATAQPEKSRIKNNGDRDVRVDLSFSDLSVILASLQTMRDGDFSVRLPGNWVGVAGKIADTFNEIESIGDFPGHSDPITRQAYGKIAVSHRLQAGQNHAQIGEGEIHPDVAISIVLYP